MSGRSERDQLASVRRTVAELMQAAWREPGFCVPNGQVYPHQWLWDSCFHSIIWAHLGSERAVVELSGALAHQADDGFVPHMVYWHEPDLHADFWGRSRLSTITQPPMYGHAVAQLVGAGLAVPADLVERARAGLLHLFGRPRTPAGLVPVFHPWETGCDDSPRWDDFFGPDPEADRRERKAELVAGLTVGAGGHAVDGRFVVGSIGFNALLAWNAAELSSIDDPSGPLADLAADLTVAIADRWRRDRWVDDRPTEALDPAGATSVAVRTLDALLATLVDPRPEAFDQLVDPGAFGARFGPRGTHRQEPTYRPDVYWRGPAWPQLSYLMMVAAERAGLDGTARSVARRLVDGAASSGFAEYWDPETGRGLGAVPQTWAGLALPATGRL